MSRGNERRVNHEHLGQDSGESKPLPMGRLCAGVVEACQMMGVSRAHFYATILDRPGGIPRLKVRGAVLVRVADVEAWLAGLAS
jgi:excisionase family DNA binding protein